MSQKALSVLSFDSEAPDLWSELLLCVLAPQQVCLYQEGGNPRTYYFTTGDILKAFFSFASPFPNYSDYEIWPIVAKKQRKGDGEAEKERDRQGRVKKTKKQGKRLSMADGSSERKL